MNNSKFDMAKQTRAYPNPTIAEALCEIHFECNPDSSDNETFLRSLKAKLGADFPSVTEQQLKQYNAAITDRGISVEEEKNNSIRLIFKHKERNHLVQLLPKILTINEVGSYPGWEVFLKDISRGWTALTAVLPSVKAKRIGLRYINLIPRRNLSEPLSIWLNSNKYYPEAILESATGFLSRNEFDFPTERLIVTLSEPNQKETYGHIIFDIDVISPLKETAVDWNNLADHLEKLHNRAWEVFSSSLSQKYEALLNGELL